MESDFNHGKKSRIYDKYIENIKINSKTIIEFIVKFINKQSINRVNINDDLYFDISYKVTHYAITIYSGYKSGDINIYISSDSTLHAICAKLSSNAKIVISSIIASIKNKHLVSIDISRDFISESRQINSKFLNCYPCQYKKFNKRTYHLSNRTHISAYDYHVQENHKLLKSSVFISSLTPILEDFLFANLGKTLDIREFDAQNISNSLKNNKCLSIGSRAQINKHVEYYPSSYISVQMSLSSASTSEEYRKSNMIKGNMGAEYGPFAGSMSSSYQSINEELQSFQKQIIQGDILVDFGVFKLTDYNKSLLISDDFRFSVKNVTDISSAKAFIKKYGTHYINTIKFGGKGSNIFVMKISDITHLQETSIGLEASIKAFFVSASAEYKHDSKSKITEYYKDVKIQVNLIGGTGLPSIHDGNVDYSSWVSTILDRPAVIDINVDLISNLITKENMQDIDVNKVKNLLDDARIEMFGAPISKQIELSSKQDLNISYNIHNTDVSDRIFHMNEAQYVNRNNNYIWYDFPSNQISYSNSKIIIIPRDQIISMQRYNEPTTVTCKRYVDQLDRNSKFIKDSNGIYAIMTAGADGKFYNLNAGLVGTKDDLNYPIVITWQGDKMDNTKFNEFIWFQIKKAVNLDPDSNIFDRTAVYITSISSINDSLNKMYLPSGSFLGVQRSLTSAYLSFVPSSVTANQRLWILTNNIMKPLGDNHLLKSTNNVESSGTTNTDTNADELIVWNMFFEKSITKYEYDKGVDCKECQIYSVDKINGALVTYGVKGVEISIMTKNKIKIYDNNQKLINLVSQIDNVVAGMYGFGYAQIGLNSVHIYMKYV